MHFTKKKFVDHELLVFIIVYLFIGFMAFQPL